MIKKIIFIFLIASAVILSSCSEYQKLLKSSDFDLKYTKAKAYYQEKDYFRAQSLFEELVTIYKGTPRGEEVYYLNAYCYYALEDFILAGYHFKMFARSFPNSKYIEEAEYMAMYCTYLNSPDYSLDQEFTYKAMEEIQLYLDKYPNSARKIECNELMDLMRQKLERKAYENAMLYFKIGDYKAAIASVKFTLKDYPDTKYKEELMYVVVKSSYLLAENSIESKKRERYQLTANEHLALVDEFPTSKYLRETERYYESSLKKIKKL